MRGPGCRFAHPGYGDVGICMRRRNLLTLLIALLAGCSQPQESSGPATPSPKQMPTAGSNGTQGTSTGVQTRPNPTLNH